jgi:hypothetical protein
MRLRYTLRRWDGSDVGTVEVSRPACAGDEVRTSKGDRMRVQAVVPLEGVEESGEGPRAGFLVVEPLSD